MSVPLDLVDDLVIHCYQPSSELFISKGQHILDKSISGLVFFLSKMRFFLHAEQPQVEEEEEEIPLTKEQELDIIFKEIFDLFDKVSILPCKTT